MTFLAERGLAHDLRNALTVISINNELLRDSADGTQQAVVDTISEAIEYAAELLRQLSNGRERQPTFLSGVRAELLVERLVSQFQASYRSVRFGFSRRGRQHAARLSVSTVDLTRCLQNLLTNAAEAAVEGASDLPEVHVRFKTSRHGVEIDVTDNGGGIESHRQDAVFDPFVSTRDQGGERGLGLYIVRSLARSANGDIHVAEHAQGTSFLLAFPAADETVRTDSTNG